MASDERHLPERLSGLTQLAFNLWWTWHQEAREVFRRLDYPLWRFTSHNPVRMLHSVSKQRLKEAEQDPALISLYDASIKALGRSLTTKQSWWARSFPHAPNQPIAYFSAEFALHQSLPIYAGGLGVLAGDHCKEAGDLGVPLVGVGFMYPQGYFHQRLSAEGWQEESYEKLNWADAPISPATLADGQPAITAVPLGDRSVLVAIWRVLVGRVTLYLLDTDLPENAPWDRELSARLYGGDRETRIQQEIILGIGGVRALKALGINAGAFHLNEGHAAFVVLQRIRELLERGRSFEDALDEIRDTTIFTTHTPVPAGHDAFPFYQVEKHLAGCWGTLGQYRDRFLALGAHDSGGGALFNMTALALRSASKVNAVSRLHGKVTRDMWADIWPGVPEPERPVSYVTNGVHVPTWMAAELVDLFTKYFGSGWRERQDDPALWDSVLSIPDEELWAVRQSLRRHLFRFVRERARKRWIEEHVGISRIVAAGTLLDPSALTIGFARRFTAYK